MSKREPPLKHEPPLYNFDIEQMMSGIKGFEGTKMRDQLGPNLFNNAKRGSLILNLDDNSGPGTHWVAVYWKDGVFFYFDSFGLPPPEELLASARDKRLFYSDNRIQMDDSTMCGYYAMMFIKQLMGGKSFYDFINQFDNPATQYNERVVRKWASRAIKK
jgi:hypothetical protein